MNDTKKSGTKPREARQTVEPRDAESFAETEVEGVQQEVEAPVPISARDIPGLGPIRVRALIKAGLNDAVTLHGATMDQLTAVPGMSDIKARHIKTYLATFSMDSLLQAAEAGRTSPDDREVVLQEVDRTLRKKHESPIMLGSSIQHGSASPFESLGQQALCVAVSLLVAEPATGYRARLLRETVGFMRLVTLLLRCEPLSDKSQDRATRRLKAAIATLTEAGVRPDLERKEQTHLADQLAQIRARLEVIVGQTLRPVPVGAEDE